MPVGWGCHRLLSDRFTRNVILLSRYMIAPKFTTLGTSSQSFQMRWQNSLRVQHMLARLDRNHGIVNAPALHEVPCRMEGYLHILLGRIYGKRRWLLSSERPTLNR